MFFDNVITRTTEAEPEAWFIQTCSAQKLHMSFSEGRHNENCLIQEGALLFCEQAVV
ncbi:hypothetical protein MJI20_28885, partial [Salmonella enterica subsp. enterica serovar Anatum]|nr:hypothetical protein [Salmonella enterica subsp. enterica serovar Anatum]